MVAKNIKYYMQRKEFPPMINKKNRRSLYIFPACSDLQSTSNPVCTVVGSEGFLIIAKA